MSQKVNSIPEGHHTVTPYLMVRGAAAAIEFYKRAFGAEEVMRMPGPDGQSVMHAEIKLGDSLLMLADEFPQTQHVGSPARFNGTTVTLHLYVPNVDAAIQRAVQSGAALVMPPQDMFWGDRFGKVRDPFGHEWSIATHVRDVSFEEMEKAAAAFFAGTKPACG